MESEREIRRTQRIGVALAMAALPTFLYAWVYYPITQHFRGDFFAMLSHRDESAGYWDGRGIGYGPVFALYDLMLRPFHDDTALRLMYAVNLLLLAATFVTLVRLFLPAPRSRLELLVALFAWVSFYPLAQMVRQDNVEITELFFLALFLWCLARGRATGAGVALGMAISTKLVPVLLLPYLAWRRRFRIIAIALGTLVAMLAVVALLKGLSPASVVDDWRHTAGLTWPNEWNNNQALSGFWWRFFSVPSFINENSAAYPHVLHPEWARLATRLTSVALVLAVAAAFIRREGLWPGPAADPAIELTELGIVLIAILLVLPHSHTHYFGLIVWIYFLALRAPASGRRTPWLFLFSYVLTGLLMPLRFADPLARRFLPVSLLELAKLYSLPLFGLLLALVALLAVHRAQGRNSQTAAMMRS